MEAKRHLLGIGVLAAAGMLASCQQDVLTELVNEPASLSQAISFETRSSNTVSTRAENSSAAVGTNLEDHHETFAVWGFKNVYDTENDSALISSVVFGDSIDTTDADGNKLLTGTLVYYNANASGVFEATRWEYLTARFWDKKAANYYFYAAAPESFNWRLNQNLKQITDQDPGTEAAKPKFPDLPEQPWVTTNPGDKRTLEPATNPGSKPAKPSIEEVTKPTAPAGTEVTAADVEADESRFPEYQKWQAYNDSLTKFNQYDAIIKEYQEKLLAYSEDSAKYYKYIGDSLHNDSVARYLAYTEFAGPDGTWEKYQDSLKNYQEWREKYLIHQAFLKNGDKEKHALSYITLNDFSLNGDNASATAGTSYTKTFKSVANDKDIMIAEPKYVDNAQILTNAPVNLDFIHLLSRLNISVYKDGFTLGNAEVKLNQLEVRNMKAAGSFNENAELEKIIGKYEGNSDASETVDLATGTNIRWTPNDAVTANYSSIKNYAVPSTDSLPNSPETASYEYVLQSLIIPQNILWDKVSLDGIRGNNTSVTDAAYKEAYLYIDYDITTREMEYKYHNLDTIMKNNPTWTVVQAAEYFMEFKADSTQKADVSILRSGAYEIVNGTQLVFKKVKDGGKTVTDNFTAYFNLASIFAAVPDFYKSYEDGKYFDYNDTEIAVFCEGWQNNIHFTIKPDVILFDADVYEWADKETVNPILN